MKLRRFVYFVMVVLLITVFAACSEQGATDKSTDSTDTSADTDTSQDTDVLEETETSETSEQATPSDSGELGEYTVSILDYELTEDYEGNPAIRVYFDFTNNSEDAGSFMFAISTEAYQNGIELETAVCLHDVDEDDNNLKDIKPGATLKCAKTFVLDDASSPVEVEASELISWDDIMLVKTFDIAE